MTLDLGRVAGVVDCDPAPERGLKVAGRFAVEFGDEGADTGLISTGLGTDWAREAADLLRARGRKVRHLHVPSLKPFDAARVLQFCESFSQITTVENHVAHGGHSTPGTDQ